MFSLARRCCIVSIGLVLGIRTCITSLWGLLRTLFVDKCILISCHPYLLVNSVGVTPLHPSNDTAGNTQPTINHFFSHSIFQHLPCRGTLKVTTMPLDTTQNTATGIHFRKMLLALGTRPRCICIMFCTILSRRLVRKIASIAFVEGINTHVVIHMVGTMDHSNTRATLFANTHSVNFREILLFFLKVGSMTSFKFGDWSHRSGS